MAADTALPFESARVECAMQWALEDLLTHYKQPSQEILARIPQGEAMEIIQALSEALKIGNKIGVRRAFLTLSTDTDIRKANGTTFNWLIELRNKPVPPRTETEDEDEEESNEQDDWRFTEGKNKKKILKFSSIEDIYNLPNPTYLISRVLQIASVSLLYGISGTGKTFTCLDLALSIAHGILWHGRKVKQGPVWYINTEGGRALKKRLKAWYQEHPWLSPSPNFKVIPWSLDLLADYQTLLDTLEEQGEVPALITFDNFSMCTDKVNQNLQEEVAAILKRLHYIADKYGCHIMMVHHTNKEGDVNGTMAFRNHVDTMIELKKEDKSQKDSPILFSSQKARDDEPFGDIRTELKQVQLYADHETGEWVTSCVVTDCDKAEPEKSALQTQKQVKQVLEILKAHGQLTCTQWLKHCVATYKMSERNFYRFRADVEQEGLVTMATNSNKARGAYYCLTDKGHELIG